MAHNFEELFPEFVDFTSEIPIEYLALKESFEKSIANEKLMSVPEIYDPISRFYARDHIVKIFRACHRVANIQKSIVEDSYSPDNDYNCSNEYRMIDLLEIFPDWRFIFNREKYVIDNTSLTNLCNILFVYMNYHSDDVFFEHYDSKMFGTVIQKTVVHSIYQILRTHDFRVKDIIEESKRFLTVCEILHGCKGDITQATIPRWVKAPDDGPNVSRIIDHLNRTCFSGDDFLGLTDFVYYCINKEKYSNDIVFQECYSCFGIKTELGDDAVMCVIADIVIKLTSHTTDDCDCHINEKLGLCNSLFLLYQHQNFDAFEYHPTNLQKEFNAVELEKYNVFFPLNRTIEELYFYGQNYKKEPFLGFFMYFTKSHYNMLTYRKEKNALIEFDGSYDCVISKIYVAINDHFRKSECEFNARSDIPHGVPEQIDIIGVLKYLADLDNLRVIF